MDSAWSCIASSVWPAISSCRSSCCRGLELPGYSTLDELASRIRREAQPPLRTAAKSVAFRLPARYRQ
jgi:hypothetical protein